MYGSTVHDLAPVSEMRLAGYPEPRIEPEVALHLARTPHAAMSPGELITCIDWVAPAFEVVFSIFPGWRFAAADAVAAYGVHAGLYLGPRVHIGAAPEEWVERLAAFTVTLRSEQGVVRSGHARNVLGSPLRSLAFLLQEIGNDPAASGLGAGEIVTTGTLTEAMPVATGDCWTADFTGIGFAPIRLRFT